MFRRNQWTGRQITARVAAMAFLALLTACSGNNNTPVSAEDSSLSFAQDEFSSGSFGLGSHGGLRGGHGLMAVLELSEQQQQQVQEILQKSREDRPHARRHRQSGGAKEEMRAARKAHHEQVYNQVLEILTPEQRQKAEALKTQLDNGEVPQELVDYHIAQLTEKLNLTAEQQEEVRELGTAAKMLALRDDDGDRRKLMQKRRDVREETHAKMIEILTPEQQEAFKEMIASHGKRAGKHGRRFGAHNIDRRLEHLTTELQLSEAQAAQIKEVFEAFQAEMEPTFGDRGRGHRRGEFREQMHEKRDSLHEQIKSILTDEQVAKFEELIKKRHG